jgi:glycosyltransferase involved in cell wall biosynthesis
MIFVRIVISKPKDKILMRITQILFSDLGGVGNVVFSLIQENFKKKFFDTSTIFTGSTFSKIYKKKINKFNCKYSFVKTYKNLQFISWIKVYKELVKFKSDIILVHNNLIIPCIIYSIFFKKKLIFIDHSALNFKNSKVKIICKLAKFFAHHVVVLNDSNYKYFTDNLKISKKNISLIPNGIDVNFYKTKNFKLNKFSKYFKIGMAGRIDYFKRQDLILDILNLERFKEIKFKVYFAGKGPLIKELNKKILKNNLDKKVIFNGYLDDKKLKKWFSELDLYVHATTGEAMSISILQAFSMKIPIIASKVSGNNELFRRFKQSNFLFKNNKKDLTNKINFFFKNKKKIINNLDNLRNLVIKNYSNRIMFDNYKNLIFKVFKNNAP